MFRVSTVDKPLATVVTCKVELARDGSLQLEPRTVSSQDETLNTPPGLVLSPLAFPVQPCIDCSLCFVSLCFPCPAWAAELTSREKRMVDGVNATRSQAGTDYAAGNYDAAARKRSSRR